MIPSRTTLLVTWMAMPRTGAAHKQTDDYGDSLRGRPSQPAPPQFADDAEADRRRQTRERLLRRRTPVSHLDDAAQRERSPDIAMRHSINVPIGTSTSARPYVYRAVRSKPRLAPSIPKSAPSCSCRWYTTCSTTASRRCR
jgi:hypothetical protein